MYGMDLISCEKARYLAIILGGLMEFAPMVIPVPQQAKGAIGGIAADIWCRGLKMDNIDSEMAMRAALGAAGGIGVRSVRAGRFTL